MMVTFYNTVYLLWIQIKGLFTLSIFLLDNTCEIAFLTCLGNKDHFYLDRVTQGGQGKYNSDCHIGVFASKASTMETCIKATLNLDF
jgi:hypothetical protein